MKRTRQRIDVNLEELDRVLDGARQTPLSEADCDKLKSALHALAALLVRPRTRKRPAPCWKNQPARALPPGLSRILTPLPRRDMDAMARRRLAARARWRSPIRSWRTGTAARSAGRATYTDRR